MGYYIEKLKDPRWQKKRLKVLERDKWTCKKCGDKKSTLHVHHLKYHGNPWETPPRFLETLCEKCHEFESSLKLIKVVKYGEFGLIAENNSDCCYFKEMEKITSCISSSGNSCCGSFYGNKKKNRQNFAICSC